MMTSEELLPQVREAIAEIEASLQRGTFNCARPGYPTDPEL